MSCTLEDSPWRLRWRTKSLNSGELVRHFFSRFFDNDLIAINTDAADMRATVINILAMLAAPGMLLPFLFMSKYTNLQMQPMYVRDLASLGEKEFFICFSMTVMGLVTVIEWEMLFPDRRDYANLTPLPIRLRTMFGAKIVALLAFLTVFSVAINAFLPVMFPAVVLQKEPLLNVIPFARCHIVSILAANTFVFFFCVAVQGILMNVLGYRVFRRVSPYVQFALVALLILMFSSPGELCPSCDRRAINPAAVYAFPPLWFLGLYQVCIGLDESSVPGVGRNRVHGRGFRHRRRPGHLPPELQETCHPVAPKRGRILHSAVGHGRFVARTLHRFVVRDRLSRRPSTSSGKPCRSRRQNCSSRPMSR